MVIQVIQPRPPISVKWGLTGDEIRLASEAAHYLASLHLPLYWATVANHHAPERKLRELFRLFKSIIAKEQDRTGLPRCLYLEILEGRPTVHSNLLFPLRGRNTSKIVNRMMASERFPGDTLDIRPADSANAFVACHAKERTPQAKYVGVGNLAKRLPGSHALGAGGGDRVRSSQALMKQLAGGGIVIPHRRIYASRALPPVTEIAPHKLIYDPDLGLFGGGLQIMAAVPKQKQPIKRRKLDDRHQDQATFALDFPPTVSELAARLGTTHQAIASMLRISRSQVSNILNGQFGPSRSVARRVLELARAA